jgi:excisionase family DNA binding protein
MSEPFQVTKSMKRILDAIPDDKPISVPKLRAAMGPCKQSQPSQITGYMRRLLQSGLVEKTTGGYRKTERGRNARLNTSGFRPHRVEQRMKMRAKGFVTVAEVADRVGVSPSTVYNWIHDERVQSLRVGSAWYVSVASVKAYHGEDVTDLLTSSIYG